MSKFQKKLLFGLFFLALLAPVGLFLPKVFHSGDAWGEWDVKTIKELTGNVPEGMAENADLWNAPIPHYTIKKESPYRLQLFHYMISGGLGLAFTFLITFVLIKIMARNEQTP